MTIGARQRKVSERSQANLRPPFKPGQSGNPKGMPKQSLSKKQKLLLLTEYAKMNPEKANPIEAIKEHNRMEGVYAEVAYQDNRVINIIVSSEKAKELTENVSRRLLNATEQGTDEGTQETG